MRLMMNNGMWENMWSVHVCEMDAAAERKGVAVFWLGLPNWSNSAIRWLILFPAGIFTVFSDEHRHSYHFPIYIHIWNVFKQPHSHYKTHTVCSQTLFRPIEISKFPKITKYVNWNFGGMCIKWGKKQKNMHLLLWSSIKNLGFSLGFKYFT